jgi:hypothetical protein
MVSTKIKYIAYNHNGGGVRHHHFSTQNNIVQEADGQASPGDTLNALGFPTLLFNGQNLPFAFMSVHGGSGGNQLYTAPGNQTVLVGSDDIEILVVYAQVGGGPGGPGVWVDAFNVDAGIFSDDLHFIEVLTPPTPPVAVDAAKTSVANNDGDVSTLSAENLRASGQVDGGVPFLEWKKIIPTAYLTNNADVSLVQNESGEIWFAFYQTPSGNPPFNIHNVIQAMESGIFIWGGDDTCGNGGHWVHPKGPGPAPFRISIDKKFIDRLSPANQKKLQSYIREYPAVANTGLEAMTRVLDLLEGVNKLLSGTGKTR